MNKSLVRKSRSAFRRPTQGSAEGGFTINPPGVGPIGSVGKPLPGSELAILDDEDTEIGSFGDETLKDVDGHVGFPEAGWRGNDDVFAGKEGGGGSRRHLFLQFSAAG